MPLIVQKYGGSSMADLDKIRQVAKQVAAVKRAGYDVAVVVSAMGKTTDQLLSLAKSLTPEPPRRELDMLLTVGERISMALLSIAIQEEGFEAVSLTGSQSGIITNDRHFDARIIEVRPVRVEDELHQGRVVIVAGFQGVSYKREITTLGRGGSDTTAVALAAALGADRCEIYSDVDGVYSADPNLVRQARHLPEISYQEMQEMASAGAKVLNPQAVEFAKQAGIAIYCRAAFTPGRETVVRRGEAREQTGVKAVVSERKMVRGRLRGAGLVPCFEEVLRAAEKANVVLKEVGVSVPSLEEWSRGSFVISSATLPDWPRIRRILLKAGGDRIELDEDVAAVSLIGEGINRDGRNLLRALEILREIGSPVLGVATTSFRISLLTKEDRLDQSVQTLHQRFIEEPSA